MITVPQVIAAVSANSEFTVEMLLGHRRAYPLAQTRQLAYLLAYTYCPGDSLSKIAREFGNRDHTTILHGVKRAKVWIKHKPSLNAWMDKVGLELQSGMHKPLEPTRGPDPEIPAAYA